MVCLKYAQTSCRAGKSLLISRIDGIIQGLIQVPFLVGHLGSWADEVLSSSGPGP